MGHEVVCSVAMRLCTKRVAAPHQQGRSTPPLSRWTARALASPESMAAPPSVRVPCAVARLEGGERPWVPWSEPWRAAGRRDAVRTSKDSPLSKEGRVTSPVRTWRHARICWPAVPSCQRRRLLEDGGEPRWPGCRSIVESLGLEVLAQVHGHLWQLVLPPAACVPIAACLTYSHHRRPSVADRSGTITSITRSRAARCRTKLAPSASARRAHAT